jgi:hypothetical protein
MQQALKSHLLDGIYINLPEKEYRDDPALGSSDIGRLFGNPYNYWWFSRMNPRRPAEKDSTAARDGRATHCCVLEGRDAFDARYVRGEDHEEGTSTGQKATATKAAKKIAEAAGLILLPAETYDRIVITAAMINKNPYLNGAFSGGMPEVSIFWTRDGIRRKARLDYLKPRGIGDLKNVANQFDKPFPKACHDTLANRKGELQAVHYLEARSHLPQFFFDGQFFAPEGVYVVDFLERCAKTDVYAFMWVFFQSEGAPITFSRILSLANPAVEEAKAKIETATDNYRRCMEHWGPDETWVPEDAPEEFDPSEMPAWWGR